MFSSCADYKFAVLEFNENNGGDRRVQNVAGEFNIPQSTVSTLLKNKEKWRQRHRLITEIKEIGD